MTASAVGAGGTPGTSYNPNSTLKPARHNPTEAAGTPQSAVTSVLLKVTDCDGASVSIHHPLMIGQHSLDRRYERPGQNEEFV